MGDLFDWVTVAKVIAGGVEIVTSNLGMLLLGVGIAPVVAYRAFALLRDAVEERRFRNTPVGQAEWILYNNFVDHYTKSGGYKLDKDTRRWARQMNLRKSQLGAIDARDTQRRVAAQRRAGSFISGYGLSSPRPQRRSAGYSGRRNYGGQRRRRRYGGY